MDITIYSIIPKHAQTIIDSIGEPYARILRKPAKFDDTFDIDLTVVGISVTSRTLALNLPSGSFEFFSIPSDTYHKIEVM